MDTPQQPESQQSDPPFPARVLLTGATGFVGRSVLRELIAKGHKAVCLVRDRDAFLASAKHLPADRFEVVSGSIFDHESLAAAAQGADAAIHLVGVIQENRLRGQTFERVHVEGTLNVLSACKAAGIRRYLHMSALGTRRDAISEYHRTKWLGECHVRDSGLDWTIFRPSIIHGPDGEFMHMMKTFVCDVTVPALGFFPLFIPVIPYFGDGMKQLQPVSVRDVAHCFVAALSLPATIGKIYELGGPEALTWKELTARAAS